MDWGSEIQDPGKTKLIPDPNPGVKKASEPGSGSAALDHNFLANFVVLLYHGLCTNGIGTNWFGNKLYRHSTQTISEQRTFSTHALVSSARVIKSLS